MVKVLIVDDNEADLFYDEIVIKEHIEEAEIQTAMDGQEALEKIAQGFEPDIILLDINMPRMNGHEFLENYSQRPSHGSVVIMLTTSLLESDKEKVQQYQCVKDYFTKPLEEDSILRIREILR